MGAQGCSFGPFNSHTFTFQLLLQPYNAIKTKKTLGDRAFQVASPGLWNGLPNDIRSAKTMDVFKSLVKTHLFRKAYACYF